MHLKKRKKNNYNLRRASKGEDENDDDAYRGQDGIPQHADVHLIKLGSNDGDDATDDDTDDFIKQIEREFVSNRIRKK